MSLGKNRGSRGDFGVGVGARSPWRVGRSSCCFWSTISHQHSITTASTSQSLPAAWQELPFFFWDAPRPVLLCGIIVSINPAVHSSWMGSPLLTSAMQFPRLQTPKLPPRTPQAGMLPWVLPGTELGNSHTWCWTPFSPSHSKTRSSYCDLGDLKASQRLPWLDRN